MIQKNRFFKFSTILTQPNQIGVSILSDPYDIWKSYNKNIYAKVAEDIVTRFGEGDVGYRYNGIVITDHNEENNIDFMGPEIERIVAKTIEAYAIKMRPELGDKQITMDTSSSGSFTTLSVVEKL